MRALAGMGTVFLVLCLIAVSLQFLKALVGDEWEEFGRVTGWITEWAVAVVAVLGLVTGVVVGSRYLLGSD